MSTLSAIAAPVMALFRLLWLLLGLLGRGLARLLSGVVGEWQWSPPRWMPWAGSKAAESWQWMRAHPGQALATVGILLLAFAAVQAMKHWYQRMPRPTEVTFTVTDPPRTDYETPGARARPVYFEFSASAAPLAQAGKEISRGVTLEPKLEGRWSWQDDKVLLFQPKGDWPVGGEFKVIFAKRGFVADNVELASYETNFKTAPFVAKLTDTQFYQDPVDPTLKKVVATVNFTHPVDPAEFEKRITLQQQNKGTGVFGLGAETTAFKVTYDKPKLNATVHSDTLPIPRDSTVLDITVAPGLVAARGGPPTKDKLNGQVTIPGLYSLRISNTRLSLAENDRFEPEQVLVLETSATVHERDMAGRVTAWVLPLHHPDSKPEERKRPHSWNDPQKIDTKVLQAAEPLKLDALPAEREFADLHSFRYEAEPGRQLYIKVDKGLHSFGGYQMPKPHESIVRVPPFPPELKIMASGSLLAMSGERKLSLLARDIPAIRVQIGQLLPNQLHHLVTQGFRSTDWKSGPQWNYDFNENNLTEVFTQVIELPKLAPGKLQYTALDLGKYLEQDGASRRGIFLLNVEAWDPARKTRVGDKSDKRMVVVTDFGIIAKKSLDNSHDVFVQSIHQGDPIAGATVEIIGSNGLAVLSQATDAQGHVRFPDLKEFQRERKPVMYVVRKGGDTSFLPIGKYDRLLDYSRFDVGGIDNSVDTGKLSAYLFSDRGIYRPGDEMRIGAIVKAADWTRPLAGVPVQLEVLDPRGLVVKSEKRRLTAAGFEELRHRTPDTAPTGNYTINVSLLKDDAADTLLGSTTVKVQEFEPDRMKISAKLSAEAVEGWISPQDLKGRVTLQNLFGTPAENRRVTAMLTLSPATVSFPSWRDYQFTDPQRAKEPVSEKLAEQKTSAQGEAEFDLNLNRFAKATYRLHLLVQGFEAEGGRSVAADAGALVSSQPFLVGYKADGELGFVARGSNRAIDFIAINPQAKRTAAEKLKLQLIERKFVSVLTKQDNGLYKYESRRKEVVLQDTALAIGVNGHRQTLHTEQPGNYSLVVRDASGLELARVDYGVAGQGNISRSLEKNAELQLTLNKKDYAAGETAEIQITAPYAGTGLITVERDKIYSQQWFKATTTSTLQKVKIPAGLEGNGYITVTFARDPASEEIYMSPLSYGVAPFSVSLDARRNTLDLTAPDLVKPGETVKFKLRASKPSKAVVFAVDEGILQVAGYQNPDPLGHFFQKRMLDVKTWQILDLVLPEFKRVMALAAPGGDGEGALGKHLNPFKRKRDQPVAYWSGLVDVGKDGLELSYAVPDYFNGSLRVIAVAVADDAVGVSPRKTTVRGDFVLSPNLPYTVTPGDEFELSVGVANNVLGSGKDAPVVLQLKTSPHFEVVGPARQELRIGELRETVAGYRIKVKDLLGSGNLSFTASLAACRTWGREGENVLERGQFRADLRRVAGPHNESSPENEPFPAHLQPAHPKSDRLLCNKSGRRSMDVSVRPATPYMVELAAGAVRKGSVDVPVPRSLFPDYRRQEVLMSPIPLALAGGLNAWLDAYPYSCTEQLMSKAMPWLALRNRPEFGTAKPPGEGFNHLIGILRSRQNSEGGYGLYAANQQVVEYVSVYAQHFLLEAKERGLAVPPELLANGNKYLEQLATGEGGESLADERTRAYAIYLLTRQGVATGSFAHTLERRVAERFPKAWQADITAAYLAATSQLLKISQVPDRLLDGVMAGVNRPADPKRAWPYHAYYDRLGHDAQLTYLIAKHFPQRAKSLPPLLLDGMVKAIGDGRYTSLSASYAVLAFDALATAAGSDATTRYALSELLKDGKTRPLAATGNLLARANFSADAAKVRLGSDADFTAYYVVNQSGFDRELPKQPLTQGFEILREYVGSDGKPVKTVKLGEEIEVRLKFRAPNRGEALDNVALVDLLPGGFDVVPASAPPKVKDADAGSDGSRHGEGEPAAEGAEGEPGDSGDAAPAWRAPIGTGTGNWTPEFADVREDRVVLYGSVGGDVQEFVYRIKATTAGNFVIPPAYGEAMYERSIKARSVSGGRLEVVKP